MYTNIKYNVMIGQQVKTFVKPSYFIYPLSPKKILYIDPVHVYIHKPKVANFVDMYFLQLSGRSRMIAILKNLTIRRGGPPQPPVYEIVMCHSLYTCLRQQYCLHVGLLWKVLKSYPFKLHIKIGIDMHY
jgi:hypothetical protein